MIITNKSNDMENAKKKLLFISLGSGLIFVFTGYSLLLKYFTGLELGLFYQKKRNC